MLLMFEPGTWRTSGRPLALCDEAIDRMLIFIFY
jgi:hypothetical protein